MSTQNQDFITYTGDDVKPIFTVLGADGVTPVNIIAVQEITWIARRNLSTAAALTKTKTLGQVAFVTDGTDGKFQVTITAADTAALSGWYMHYASIKDSTGAIVTVEVGRMNVGAAPNWTWDPGSVGIDSLYTVRDLIGDTVQSDQQLSDQQIRASIAGYPTVYGAAAECCRKIAAWYSRQVDTVEGLLRTMYSSRRRNYMAMAADLEARGFARGGVIAYVGGTSANDKATNVQNTDRVPPSFVLAMFDNLLPEFPVGHEVGVQDAQGGQAVNDSGLVGLP